MKDGVISTIKLALDRNLILKTLSRHVKVEPKVAHIEKGCTAKKKPLITLVF